VKTCAGCLTSMKKAHAYHGEDPYCTRCYYREFEPVVCTDCGQKMRDLASIPRTAYQAAMSASSAWTGVR